ncbi:MAG: hypothetical protein Kapaf2KO_06330 [Candidatus Kapaibacteriales bacterium]
MIKDSQDYFSLTKHHPIQLTLFLAIVLFSSALLFYLSLPVLESSFENYLLGSVVSDGKEVQYLIDQKSELRTTDYLTYWAIDVYKGTASEARYWVNPLLSLFIPFLLIGLIIGLLISSLMGLKLGYIRQQINKVMVGYLDEITLKVHGYHGERERSEILAKLLNADLRNLHDYERQWGLSLDDLLVLNKGIKWIESGVGYQMLHFLDGIRLYMRFHFTHQYSNYILGLVYVGAAVLIIIIGLRGLKFIPATEPSLVFFALGLEFSLLILFAVTLMFSKEEEQQPQQDNLRVVEESKSKSLVSEENRKKAEKLLKMFIMENKK